MEVVQKDLSKNNRAIFWMILKIAWPVAVEQLFNCFLNSLSTMLVSSIGKEAVNAVSMGNQVNYLPYVFLQAFNVGGTALVARCLGMKDDLEAKKAAGNTLFLNVIIGIAAGLLCTTIGGPVMRLLGATDDYYYYAIEYISFCAVGIVFEALTLSMSAILRAAGKTTYTMIFNIAASVVYVVSGKIFIDVLGMGISGVGMAYVCAKLTGFVIAFCFLFFSKKLPIKLSFKFLRPRIDVISRILKVAISAALESLTLRIGYMIFTAQITGLGTEAYAAHNIGNQIDDYSLAFAQSLSIALTSLVGRNLGANLPDVADQCFKQAIKVGIVISLPFFIAFLTVPGFIANIFIKDAGVQQHLVVCLRMLAICTPGQLINMAICGGLRGGGDTKWPLVASIVGILLIRTGVTFVMINVFHLGLLGAWIAMAMDQNIRCLVSFIRYRSKKWKLIRV